MTSINLELIKNFKKEFENQYNELAMSRLENAVQNKFTAPSLTTVIVKNLALFTAYVTGGTLVAASLLSSLGLPTIFNFFIAAPLGPVALLASFAVGLFIMTAQLAVPALLKLVARYSGRFAPEPEMVDLVLEEEVEKNNIKLFSSTNKVIAASLGTVANSQAEEKIPAAVTEEKSKGGFFKNTFGRFFNNKNKSTKPTPLPVVAKEVPTLRDDINVLWPIPAISR